MHPYRGGILVLGDLVTWDSGKLHFGGSHVHAAPFHVTLKLDVAARLRHDTQNGCILSVLSGVGACMAGRVLSDLQLIALL